MTQAISTSSTVSKRPSRPSLWNGRSAWLLILLAAIGWSLAQAGFFQRDLVNEGGWELVRRFLRASLHPELGGGFLALVFEATLVTLAYAVMGTFISLVIGALGGLFVSERWWESVWPGHGPFYRIPWALGRGLLAFPRGIHELLWGLFFVNVFGLDPLTAVFAIAVPYGAIVAKIFAEIIDETPRRPFDALLNSGVSPLKAFLYTLIPQAFPDLLSYAFYRFECAIRAAAVLGVIGAGGLGYQILLSVQTLRYEEMWTLFFALMLLSGGADFWSALLRQRLGRLDGTDTRGVKPQARDPVMVDDRVIRGSLVVGALLLPLSLSAIRPDFSKLWSPRTAELLRYILDQLWPPRWGWESVIELFHLSGQTLAMSLLSALFASLGGLALSFLAANNFLLPGGILDGGYGRRWRRVWGTAVLVITRALLLLMRAIPAPIWALVLLFVFFPGILPGALALGLYNLGVLGRLMAEVIENQDERPLRALKSQGASGGQVFLYGALPATLPRFIAYCLYRWEIAIRATVIVGLVGAGGLGRLLTQQLSAFDFRSVIVTLFFYIGLTFLVDLISTAVRRTVR